MTEDTPAAVPFALVAVASSAGGIHGVSVLLDGLGADLGVPVLLVQHLDPRHRTLIAEVLGRRTALRVKLAELEERVLPGTVYVAPPDRHLLIDSRGFLSLSSTAAVHFVRPSADVLFASVAASYGSRAIAVVLTGTGSDGADGAVAVRHSGGTVIVQDPRTAQFAGMPDAAVAAGAADFVLPLEGIPAMLRELVEAKRQS